MSQTPNAYKWGLVAAGGSALMLLWLAAGVGIIGADGDRANMMYLGVLAVGITGALIARFKPVGMARALVAMAVAHAVVGAVALVAGLGQPHSGPLEILGLTGLFIVLFAGSARLFQQASQNQSRA